MRLQEAIDLGLEVLNHLGEKIPKQPGRLQVLAELFTVKRLQRGKTDSTILSLPDMTDKRKLAAMNILNLMIFPTYSGKIELFPMIALRMAKLTMKFGLSAISSFGFTVYGMVLHTLGDIDGAYRFSELGLSILDNRYSAVKKEWFPRIAVIHYGMISPWKNPLHTEYESLYEAYEIGIRSGDREYTLLAIFLYCRLSFLGGSSLHSLEPMLRDAVNEMRKYNQDSLAVLSGFVLEASLLLMAKDDDPIVTQGSLVKWENGFAKKVEDVVEKAGLNFELFVCQGSFNRLIVCYHSGDMEAAVRMVEEVRNLIKLGPTSPSNITVAFYSALACLTMIRQSPVLRRSERKRLLSFSRRYLKYLKKHVKYCPANIECRILILEAEVSVLEGQTLSAMTRYARAQSLAENAHFLDVQALACERASLTLHESRGNETQKFFYLERCIELYEKWGATVKVERMINLQRDWQSLTMSC